ncbi:SRPBCC domain-containing protein [Candidatus Kapabacteria bacterium]|nr:SRPBCC domain-containing protein [Candidatus Kapabacteria bacterium]
MIEIVTKRIINKSPEYIWNHLVDFRSYSKWNPFITNINGERKIGANLDVTIKNGKSEMKFKPKILCIKENKELRWKGKLLITGIFDGEHYFILNKLGDDKTELIHGEIFTGILSGVILKKIKEKTIQGFEKMNQALAML